MRKLLLLLAFLLPRAVSANPCVATDAYSTAMCALNPTHYYRLNEDPNAVSATAFDNGNGTTKNGGYTSCGGTSSCVVAPSLVGLCDRAYKSVNATASIRITGTAHDADFEIPTGNAVGWSVDFWYKMGSQGGVVVGGWQYQYLFYGGRGGPGVNQSRGILTRSNSVAYEDTGDVAGQPDNASVHVTATTVGDGAGGINPFKFYVQGTLISTITSGSGTFGDGSFGSVSIAVDGTAGANFFGGTIDEVAFFNYALTQANINTLTTAAQVCAASGDDWPYSVKREHRRQLEPPRYLVPGWLTFAQEMHRAL